MIYYFCPDHDVPSWGIGMLYYHVFFLSKNNIDACVLHNKKGFRVSWLYLKIPIKYLEEGSKPSGNDILIVPEFYFEDKVIQKFVCRKILFVQNSFILFERLSDASLINKLGYEAAFYYMPHLKKVLSTHLNIPLYETPAFIAEYYFKEKDSLDVRKKNIIIYPKSENRDYNIVKRLLRSNYKPDGILNKLFSSKQVNGNWKVVIMENLSHKAVAKVMQESFFFINLNTHEAFNSSVPEAMAAGCINFTYDAFGPSDFLRNSENAFVFNNNHVFDLFEKLTYYTANFEKDSITRELDTVRKRAYETAGEYTLQKAELSIVDVFKKYIID